MGLLDKIMEEDAEDEEPRKQISVADANIDLLSPTNFVEAGNVTLKLKAGRVIIINLKQLDFNFRQRFLDFISGSVLALEGSINKISQDVIICSPKNISVVNKIVLPKTDAE